MDTGTLTPLFRICALAIDGIPLFSSMFILYLATKVMHAIKHGGDRYGIDKTVYFVSYIIFILFMFVSILSIEVSINNTPDLVSWLKTLTTSSNEAVITISIVLLFVFIFVLRYAEFKTSKFIKNMTRR